MVRIASQVLVTALFAVACGSRAPVAISHETAPGATPFGAPERALPHLEWADLPGCTHAAADSVEEIFDEVDRAMTRTEVTLDSVVARIDSAWTSPCLTHIARFFQRPRVSSLEELRALWSSGLRGARAMIGGLYVRDGMRFLYVPPATAPFLDDDATRALAPWRCSGAGASCGHAGTFIARAERAFDEREKALRSHRPWETCSGAGADGTGASAFEAWARCVAAEQPRTYRYARTIELRAPSHGWFILRGRRGHYRFSDELRAYDLATGAAYVARSEAALALGGVGVDFEATDADRKVEAFSGNVLVDALRELAFVALTARALGPARSEMTLVPVPRSLRVEVSDRPAGFVYDIPESEWGSSEQTSLSFALIDDGRMVADGAFTWPSSSVAGDQRAADVLMALEAGLERGCAGASLPRAVGRGVGAGMHPIDADMGRQVKVALDLERALEELRARRCR